MSNTLQVYKLVYLWFTFYLHFHYILLEWIWILFIYKYPMLLLPQNLFIFNMGPAFFIKKLVEVFNG